MILNKRKNKSEFTCYYCSTKLIWGGDNLCNEESDDYDDNDTAVLSNFVCPTCGCYYEIWQPTKDDRINIYNDYYKEN
jgi:predicted RNA-binding Zn-ribbon protein involved in translation (DUF1610 family)